MRMSKKTKKEDINTPDKEDPVEEQTAAEGEDLTARLKEKEKEAAGNYDKYLRAVAELENYKKRAIKERTDAIRYGNENLIKDILPLVDNLERALQHAGNSCDFAAFKKGLELLRDQLLCTLEKHGVRKIECTDTEFDPHFHEAMFQIDSGAHEENKVIEELERGYILDGRLLRPAKVSVCKRAKADYCKEKNTED